jgi:hypothetical protein
MMATAAAAPIVHCKPLLCCLPLQAVGWQMMVQSGMCIENVGSAYGCAIQPWHRTRNYLPSTLNYPYPCLPPILHASANLSSSSPHPCKGIPPELKHSLLSVPRESALQALEEIQVQAKGQDEGEQQHTCFIANLPLASPLEDLPGWLLHQLFSGSHSKGSIKRAVPPCTRPLAWPSKLRTQGLTSVLTQTLSPSA